LTPEADLQWASWALGQARPGTILFHNDIVEYSSERRDYGSQRLRDSKFGTRCLLEVVVICELLASHYSSRTSEQSHARLPTDSPFDHLAVGLARVVHKTGNSATGGIDDHLVVEAHEIITLAKVSKLNFRGEGKFATLSFL
jgi:hypothetical protein